MERVLRQTPATISNSWYEGGVIVDPGTVTIQIDRDNGTNLVAGGTATSGTGAAARTYNLTTTHTALLDQLKITWTSPTKGTVVTYVEVVGGFLFNLSDARALKPLNDTATYTAERIAEARTLAEQSLEDACGVAFVPRYKRETIDGSGTGNLILSYPRVTSVRSATLDAVALTSTELTAVKPRLTGHLYSVNTWTRGYGNYEVVYEHGHPFPPARVGRAALLLARRWLVESPFDDRATEVAVDGSSMSFATGGPTDIPEVNAVIEQYGYGSLIA